jgi:hypothetical protein
MTNFSIISHVATFIKTFTNISFFVSYRISEGTAGSPLAEAQTLDFSLKHSEPWCKVLHRNVPNTSTLNVTNLPTSLDQERSP